jgi:LysR family transcriptional regulator of gallate degradation
MPAGQQLPMFDDKIFQRQLPKMPRSVQLKTLRLCLVVAEQGSLLKAAQHCAIHPSALSRRIRELERALGEPIFERQPWGMAATVSGQDFLARLRRALAELDRTVHAFK